MTKSAAQMIDPREFGQRKLDLQEPLFDANAVARADKALQAMGDEMQTWLTEDAERLQQARLAADAAGWTADTAETVAGVAHDLKGMGATYGSTLATQIAASLCRLIETDAGKAETQRDPTLARAHVDALRAAVRDGISSPKHPIGRALLQALEASVDALGVAPR